MLSAAASALLVVGVLAATATLASRVSSLEVLSSPNEVRGGEPRPASAVEPSFAPLRAEFLESQLGPSLAEFLAPPSSPDAADRPDPVGPEGDPGDEPTPTTTTTLLGPVEPPLPQFSELALGMAANRARVEPGEHIGYTVAVTNAGNRDFRGQLSITSHHPFWTTDSSTPCDDPGVEPDPHEPCVNPPLPVPGLPFELVHTVRFSFGGSIPPGETVERGFRVRVNPGTPSGTEIENHAHLDVVGDDGGAETSDPVVVTVR